MRGEDEHSFQLNSQIERTSVVWVSRVERLDSKRANEVLLVERQGAERVLGDEQLGRDGHRDSEVRAQLVIGAVATGRSAEDVLVDATACDERRVDDVVLVLRGICVEP